MIVIKRDGLRVPFDENKIKQAILKAFQAIDGNISEYALQKAENIAAYVDGYYEDEQEATVEEIQDLVENGLMATKRKDVARAYVKYRAERTRAREKNSELRKTVKEKMSASNVQNQNANVDEHSFGGRMGESNSAVMRQLALDEYLSPMAKENHINNMIYIHKLNCA